ncbi:protein FAM234A isoform X2 [Sphaerodactylus townsendi]|uniref:protein FAM234A isoform X2 n=1 Tax=Sphaerodactylus townsendi TaxID=933632 RepID=UPI0020262544|nr:protein FAM234A isoform X2 [Sphaerodactylus townsendi]
MEGRKELEAEIRPLKKEEEGGAAAAAAAVGGERAGPAKKAAGRLSRWRTAAFFLSLFLCLAVVFAFSFIIPCPVRPVSQRTWNAAFAGAAYKFLEVQDVDGDRVQDVLFAFRASEGSHNSSSSNTSQSCSEGGFPPPCAFIAAVSGTNGSTLWEEPVAEDLQFMDCSFKYGNSQGCLVVGKPASLAAVDLKTGKTVWRVTNNLGMNSTALSPLLIIPDVSGDGVLDLLVFAAVGEEIQSSFYSGKTGEAIGSGGSLPLPGRRGHLMQVTKTGAHYVLFYTVNALYGYSLKQLFTMAAGSGSHEGTSLKEDPQWQAAIDKTTHNVPLLRTGEIRSLMKVPGKSGTDLLLVRSAMLELLDGQRLDTLWSSVVMPPILSQPVLGSFTPDEVDIVIESQVTTKRKKLQIVEGSYGSIKWEMDLLWRVGTPAPSTLPTADHRSVFLFWGDYQQGDNGTASEEASQNLYLFHPSLPNVLLWMNNSTESIVAFQAVLFERSRHACYVLLTGPQTASNPGLVVLSKQKLKEDIANSHVIWLNQLTQDTEQNVRDRFLRMRYHSP